MVDEFDWDAHWKVTSEPEDSRRFAVKMANIISVFIRKENVKSVADYGCGPATLLFTLAKRFPQIEFYGFDVADSIIQRNKERAAKFKLKNLHFRRDNLPNPRKERTYDLVLCFATLHYVKKIGKAVKDLFNLVNPGGDLIFNYPNVYIQKWYHKTSNQKTAI